MSRRAPLLLALLLASCAPTAPPVPVSAPAPASPPASVPSPLLALVPATAIAVVRVDWKAARASPLYAKLLAEGAKLGLLDPQKPHCVLLPDAVDELVVASTGPERTRGFLAMRFHDEAVVRRCMPDLVEASSIPEPPVAGHEAFPIEGGQIAVIADGLAVAGDRAEVELALAKWPRSAPVAPIVRGLDLSPGAVMSIYREGPGFFGEASPVSLVLETNAVHLAVRASGTLASPEAASALLLKPSALRDKILANRGPGTDTSDAAAIRGIVADLHLAAEGARVHAEIEVKGGADEQLRFATLVGGMAMALILNQAAPPPPDHE